MASSAKKGGSLTVVLVDDDVELARRLEGRCRSVSFYFRSPALVSPEWAASLDAVDLVVWDWAKLPGAEQRRVVREVQSRHPDLPMLVVDLSLEDEGAEEIVGQPATDFVRKPVDFEEVYQRLDRLLASRRRSLSRSRLRRAPAMRLRPPQETAPTQGGPGDVPGGSAFEHVAFDLHSPESGRLDARRVSRLFGVPTRRIAVLLGQKPQTVSKTPDSRSLQPGLTLFERIASALLALIGSEEGLRVWMNAANPQLDDRAPMELVLAGEGEVVADLLESMLVGQPG